MRILTVIPLQKNSFKEELTYFSANDIPLGSVVNIPIRNKIIIGLVIESIDASTLKSEIKGMGFNLKKIIEAKQTSIFRPEFIESVINTSKYFASNKSGVMSYLIPKIVRDKYDEISKAYSGNKSSEKTTSTVKTEKLLFQAPTEERISYYKTLVRESFANKKSVFIALPTEYDIKNFENDLKKGIENFTIPLYSSLSLKKTLLGMEKIMQEEHPVLIIGTAPFLALPRHDLDIIIIEHENSSAYKTMVNPYFDLRTFIEIFAAKIKVKLVLADTILRFETIARKESENLTELRPMSFRINFEGEIEVFEKNKKNFLGEEKFKIIGDKSIEEIKNAISANKSVFVFSLRKGLATFTVCRNCGTEVICDSCMSPLVLYTSRDKEKRMFVCNKCKIEKSPETVCEHCGSFDLMPLGIGTDIVFEEIQKSLLLWHKNKIFKLDKEAAKSVKEALEIIKKFEETPGSVLVGTEMALFYLKNKVSLSVIGSFDSLWSIPNFRMSEKILQIMLSIIDKTERKIIIETKNTNDGSINAVKNGNLMHYVREELEDRRTLGYPPFKRFIKVSFIGDKDQTIKTRKDLANIFSDYNPNIFGGFASKLKGSYITNMLIKLDINEWVVPGASNIVTLNEELFRKISLLPSNFKIQIDPEDLL